MEREPAVHARENRRHRARRAHGGGPGDADDPGEGFPLHFPLGRSLTDNLLQHSAGFVLLREIESVRASVEAYPDDESLWKPMPGVTNTGGTLALHIAGNLRHFLGNTVGGVPYTRDRDSEFSNRSATRAELAAIIEETRNAIVATIPKLTRETLAKPFPLQIVGRTVSTADFIVHLASHLAYHLGQMDYHRRFVTGKPVIVPAVEVSKIPELRV